MAYYDQPFDHMKARNAKEANEAVDRLRRSRIATPGKPGGQFERPFDHRKAEQARQAQRQVENAQRAKVQRPAPKATPKPTPKPATPSMGAKIGNALTRPRSMTVGGAAKAVGRVAGRALSLPYQAAAGVGYLAGDAVKDTETAQAMQRPVTDAMAQVSGVEDLQQRMLSDDPAVSKAAVAEYKAANPDAFKRPVDAAAAPAATPEAAPAVTPSVATDPQGGNAPAVAPVAPVARPNYQVAPGQSNPDILTRPTLGADGKPVIDPATGKAVPEFTDAYSVTGLSRPVPTQGEDAAEQARVDKARQQYIDNTTGSDGRRYFGGSAVEKLREAQMVEAKKGDRNGVVARQLADEGLTPEQRAARDADPVAYHQANVQANQSAAKAQMEAFKQSYNMNRNAKTDARLNRTAAMKEADSILSSFKDTAPEAYQQLMAMAGEQFDPSTGESISSVVQRLLSSFELDGGVPLIDENGQLVQRQQQATEQAEPGLWQKSVDYFLG